VEVLPHPRTGRPLIHPHRPTEPGAPGVPEPPGAPGNAAPSCST
jgi:hypothetical protein